MAPAAAPRSASRRRFAAIACGLATAFALGGCAVQTPRLLAAPPAGLPAAVELADTPFFPDDSHFCGPAALATSLSAAGFATRPEALVDKVFLPGREGSLQLEMLAGARRAGALAVIIPGTLEALMRETAAGNPVVVLQNLGLSWAPSWHYAVVIGYELDGAHFLLRSGPMKRQQLAFRTFEHTWDRSGRWAFVALPPGRLPVTATETEATRALLAFERSAQPAAAATAYRAGLARWPANLVLAMGLGNTLHAAGDEGGAEAAFRAAAERHNAPAAWNNLARVLLERGRLTEARAAAGRALGRAGPLEDAIRATLDEIGAREQRRP